MKNFTAEQLTPMAREATRLLKAMAHPSRLLICCQLREGEMSVGQIEVTLGIRQPNLSRELARLRDDGIVTTRRESRVVFYRLDHPRAHALIDAICEVMIGRGDVDTAVETDSDVAPARVSNGLQVASAAVSADATVSAASGQADDDTPVGDDVLGRAGGYGVFARTGADTRGESS